MTVKGLLDLVANHISDTYLCVSQTPISAYLGHLSLRIPAIRARVRKLVYGLTLNPKP